jgi:hypothetical protein
MKNFISSFLLCFALLEVNGQVNLVPNPSFEERTGCPEGYPDLDGKLNDWMSFRGTPDYFNNCSIVAGYQNQSGFQEPHSGYAYTGIATYHKNIPNARENLATQLLEDLTIGDKYFVSFFVSAGFDSVSNNIASNKLGALFTTYSFSDPNSISILPNNSQIYTDLIIDDTANWLRISGSFIADSNYKFLVIGNFFDDNSTDTLHFPNKWGEFVSYNYIDDVCVSTDSAYAQNWTTLGFEEYLLKRVIIYPNPVSDVVFIQSDNIIESIQIVDKTGQIVHEEENLSSNNVNLSLNFLSANLYFLKINTSNGTVFKKIIKN